MLLMLKRLTENMFRGIQSSGVYGELETLFVKTAFPLSAAQKNALLKFSTGSKEWDLYLDAEDKKADPMEYPLDGLILYYLTVIYDDIFIHSSGINYNGKGYLFSGVSGKGKTTMSGLWRMPGER